MVTILRGFFIRIYVLVTSQELSRNFVPYNFSIRRMPHLYCVNHIIHYNKSFMLYSDTIYLSEPELNELFEKGLKEYHNQNFYKAHDIWEEMWHNKNFTDRKFIQGLIQLTASFYKIQTGNLKGARSLLEKSQNKFSEYQGFQRNINIDLLNKEILFVKEIFDKIAHTQDFSFTNIPKLSE